MSKPLYLVTGGAGFIGSHLVEALVGRGDRVRVLDDFSTGKWENLAGLADGVEVIEGDVTDPAAVHRAAEGAEYVLHHAAIVSVERSLGEPRRVHEINATGTLNVLEAARAVGVNRFVFASSPAIYGNPEHLPVGENQLPCPLSPYGASKAASEAYCRAYGAAWGLPTVVLRYFNVYGPRQDPGSPYSGVVAIFADWMARGERPVVYGDGHQTRDFVHVSDVVRATLLACEQDAAIGGTFNIGSGRQTSILELVAAFNWVLGTGLAPEFRPPREGEVRHSQADVRLAQKVLGWRATIGLTEGLAAFLDFVSEA